MVLQVSNEVKPNKEAANDHDPCDKCYVDSDVFNQLLQCCFDPSHLNTYNTDNIGPRRSKVDTNSDNKNYGTMHMDMMNLGMTLDMNNNGNNSTDGSTVNNMDLSQTPKHENDTSSYETDSVKTNAGHALPMDILNCCTPIDLNPCCASNYHELSNSSQYHSNGKCPHHNPQGHDDSHNNNLEHIHNHNHNHSHSHSHSHDHKLAAELSEMVILNNFFSACCNDSNLNVDDNSLNDKYSLISPPISSIKGVDSTSESYPKLTSNANNVSSIRDSLKTVNKNQNKHHHHLLHLHHHNPEDSSRSHTHDIIFHHHNANGCLHNNQMNHHHHLHFEDEINGQKIKHDFILPDCEIGSDKGPFNTSPNTPPSLNLDPNDSNTSCTDFLTSSICNLDYIFDDPEIKLENSQSQCYNPDKCHKHENIKLASQKKCYNSVGGVCHGNSLLKSHQLNHHHLHHHYPKNNDFSHEEHFHTHKNIGCPSNGSIELKSQIKMEDIPGSEFDLAPKKLTKSDPLICKWDECNTQIDSEDLDSHIFKNHLQFLPLSPGIYGDGVDDKRVNEIKQSNLQLRCGWDHCDFTTIDIDKFLEHVPEHTEVLKRKVTTEDSEEEKDVHVCHWVDPETGVECGERFELTEDVTNHIITNHIKSGKSSYICHWKGCCRGQKPFSQRQKIIRHLNTHTKHKPFECEICHKKFSLDLMLKQHMRIHTGEKPYKCDLCGKTFKTSSSLTIHLRIHSGAKPMVCKICGKRFNESSNLNKHMKIHFRKYRCELCLKSFDSETKFKRHQLVCKKKKISN